MADILNIILCASKLAFLVLLGRKDSFELIIWLVASKLEKHEKSNKS